MRGFCGTRTKKNWKFIVGSNRIDLQSVIGAYRESEGRCWRSTFIIKCKTRMTITHPSWHIARHKCLIFRWKMCTEAAGVYLHVMRPIQLLHRCGTAAETLITTGVCTGRTFDRWNRCATRKWCGSRDGRQWEREHRIRCQKVFVILICRRLETIQIIWWDL